MMKKCTEKTVTTATVTPKECNAKPQKKSIRFTFEGAVGSTVCLAGSFNDWSEKAKKMTDKKKKGIFTCQCMLPLGTYQYKFIVDGIWTLDNSNPNFIRNDLGTLNSVIKVA